MLSACSSNVKAPAPGTQAPQAVAPVTQAAPQVAKVALLLPLSGANAQIGQAMLESAQLALFDLAGDRFELLPRDTKGTPNGAADAARQAISEGARIILGPLFGAEVAAVKPVAQNAGVGVLAFTNDWTQAGNGTYVMGFVPGDQVNRVVGFARSRGVARYVALAPRNAYGDAVVTALQNTTRQLGGQIAQVERYDPTVTDLSQPARQVTQAGIQPQAVMLAEGGPRAQGLANALAANGLNPQQVRLLGTGLWDEPGLGQEPSLVGAWFAAPAPQTRADFESRFEQTYGHKPPRIATLSYDATAIAAVLAKMGGPVPFDPASLNNPNGFEGMDGLFRLRPNGQVERALAVLEVTPSGSRVLDPAPPSFELLGQ
ncbi:penicillin-binding protein activator [Azospirillum sp. sgz302134]